MKPTTIPLVCGIALAAISAAGFSHWWSIRTVTSVVHSKPAAQADYKPIAKAPAAKKTEPAPVPQKPQPEAVASQSDASQKKFYETLIQKMSVLENRNRNLEDQLAETNRDMIKLEFRVDTHSESFRPLPTSEEPINSSTADDGPGVLPPRAEPIFLPSEE